MDQVASQPTYKNLFAYREFRAIFIAQALSAGGDMLAKVAVSILVFDRTGSALLAAAAFAISYLPGIIGGPFLATIADRAPWRTTLVRCDLARAALIAIVALPHIPLPIALFLLFAVALLSAPFEAARSALLPTVLPGDTYVLGVTVGNVTYQLSQVLGFAAGGAIVAALSARGALLLDAATFALSAFFLWRYVAKRPAPTRQHVRTTIWHDTLSGLRLIAGHSVLRRIVLLAWCASAFGFAHEGIAAPFAEALNRGPATAGLLLASAPLGMVIGGLSLGRFVKPAHRLLAAPYLAVTACLSLVPIGLGLPLVGILFCLMISGAAMSFMLPINAAFNQMLPSNYRGRAAGVVIAGLMAGQGLAILLAGALANRFHPAGVISLSGAIGTGVTLISLATWPTVEEITTPITISQPNEPEIAFSAGTQ
ncbi:MAG: MFS transporter [Corynebacteriales bacterium]|nr:MFS transporter [Mycobacteriales bacterium]